MIQKTNQKFLHPKKWRNPMPSVLSPRIILFCAAAGMLTSCNTIHTSPSVKKTSDTNTQIIGHSGSTKPTNPLPAAHSLRKTALHESEPTTFEPKALIGLSGDIVLNRLGQPGFIRRDVNAEIWHFSRKNCTLHIFLYSDNEQLRVSYVTLRNHERSKNTQKNCYQFFPKISQKSQQR